MPRRASARRSRTSSPPKGPSSRSRTSTSPRAQAAAAEIGTSDVAVGVQADVSDEEQVKAAIDATLLAFGGLDLVVNNAGLSLSKALLETTVADWDLQQNVMAKGSFLVSRTAAKALIEQGPGGDIVYISSKNSVFAGPNNIAYSATKADQARTVGAIDGSLEDLRALIAKTQDLVRFEPRA